MKSQLLERIALRIDLVQRQASANPHDARTRVALVRLWELHRELSELPPEHRVFSEWQRNRWEPVAFRSGLDETASSSPRSGLSSRTGIQ